MKLVVESAWTDSTRKLLLDSREVHVWKINLDDAIDATTSLLGLLSEQERDQARRFYHKRDRSGYVISHVTLRVLLGGYLDVHPEAITFALTAEGKPYLLPLPGRDTIGFNLSHSGGFAVIGIASGQEIGIDLEYVDWSFPIAEAARQVLTDREFDTLASLPDRLRVPAFYRFWTMKEAYLKGVGTGVSREMDSFEISLLPGKSVYHCCAAEVSKDAGNWMLLELPLIPGYASALAVGFEPTTVRVFNVLPDACFGFLCLRDFSHSHRA